MLPKAITDHGCRYKQKVLLFLLSHATSCPSSTARLALLRLTQPVRSALKARTLRALLEEIAEGGVEDPRVASLTVGCVDASCVPDLEEDGEDGLWDVLIKLLQAFVREGTLVDLSRRTKD